MIAEDLNKEPIRLSKVPKNKNNKKIKKDGMITAYRCRFCDYESLNIKHVRSHTQICPSFKEMLSRIQRNDAHQEILNEYAQDIHLNLPHNQPDLANRMKAVEQELAIVKKRQINFYNCSKNQKAEFLAESFIEKISLILLQTLKLELSTAIYQWLESGIDVENLKYTICKNLVEKVREINMAELADNFKKNLDLYHQNLKNQMIKKRSHKNTWSRMNSAYKFLRKYEEIHFMHQSKLVSELLEETRFQRNNVIQYFHRMISHSSDLFPFRKLPARLTDFDQSIPRQLRKVSLEEIKIEIEDLRNQQEFTLCTDLWAATVMGLRRTQILTMQFQDEEGRFARALKIFQQKNQHQTMRVIPNSLKSLIHQFKVIYPMSQERFLKVRNFCIKKFQRFYGLRHVCITSLMAALYQNSMLARFHKNYQSTTKFYLDHHSTSFVNKIFALRESQKSFDEENPFLLTINSRRTKKKEFINEKDNKIEISQPFKDSEIMQLAEMDSLLFSSNAEMSHYLENNQDEQSKVDKIAERYIVQNYSKEFAEKSYNSLSTILQGLVDEGSFVDSLSEFCEKNGELPSDKNSILVAKKILSNSLDFLVFNDACLQPTVSLAENQMKQKIVIARLETGKASHYRVSEEKPLRVRLPRKSKQNKTYQIDEEDIFPMLTFSPPKCTACFKKNFLDINFCENCKYGFTQCKGCLKSSHICLQDREKPQIMEYRGNIIPHSNLQAEDVYLTIEPQKNKNNIRKIIEQILRKRYRRQSYGAYSDIPCKILTSLSSFSPRMTEEIYKNREYEQKLPIFIKETEGKGYGVFALADLEAQRLVCSYIGVLGIHQSVDLLHDSSFFLGWICQKEKYYGLFCEAKHQFNVGRFLNSSPSESSKLTNCSCKIGLISDGENNQIAIILYTSKKISKGEQLQWYYGRTYWKK